MLCPLCRRRPAKRACPGTGQDICAVCCGTKRLREIACPPNCIYLESAQRHPAAVVKKQYEQDLRTIISALGPVSESQLQLFFVIHAIIARYQPTSFGRLQDADVADAVGALASTYETAGRGVLYEHQAPSAVGEELRRELKSTLDKVGARGGSRFEKEAAVVLRGIERGARHQAPGLGSEPQAYLATVARLLRERPPDSQDRSALIVP